MSKWDKPVDVQRRDERISQERKLCIDFKDTFSSEKGSRVLDAIKEMCLHNKDPFLQGIPPADLGYLVGKQAVAKLILEKINQEMGELK